MCDVRNMQKYWLYWHPSEPVLGSWPVQYWQYVLVQSPTLAFKSFTMYCCCLQRWSGELLLFIKLQSNLSMHLSVLSHNK